MRRPSEKEEGDDNEGRRDGRAGGQAKGWEWVGKEWQTVEWCGREREGTARRRQEVNKNGEIDD